MPKNFTQEMDGNRSFPEMPDPGRKAAVKVIPPKFKNGMMGGASEGMGGYGEQGDGVEVNTDAPYGNKKLLDSPFKPNQAYAGSSFNGKSSQEVQETSIRSVRVADLGADFGHGSLPGSVEIAGKQQSLPKKFLSGGKSV